MEFCVKLLSLPLWERGLKYGGAGEIHEAAGVAPLVGAWIEIQIRCLKQTLQKVAPLVGAWIEITNLPGSRQRQAVAPLVGAWIEISP